MFSNPKETLEYYSIRGIKDYGNEIAFSCPFHGLDETPSASINTSTGLWMCQACGAKGNMQHFIAMQEGCSFEEAESILENGQTLSQGVVDSIKSIKFQTKAHQQIMDKEILKKFRFRHKYILRRGFTEEILRRFQVGYDKESNRITIPCFDLIGNLLGMIERGVTILQKPRYLYSKGFKRKEILFGINNAVGKSDRVVLCEGSLDAMRSFQYGHIAVAVLGATISHEQFNLLQSYFREVVLCPDNDEGGRGFMYQCSKSLDRGFANKWRVMKLPSGKKDICETDKNEFNRCLENATSLLVDDIDKVKL